MKRNRANNQRRCGTRAACRRGGRRLRPTVMELEGRSLLSTFTVNSTADDGSEGALRRAICQANASSAADTIAFSDLFSTPQTIALSGKPLILTDTAATTITGPGMNSLTVSGGGSSGVFEIRGGAAGGGGGGLECSGTATLTNCTITGNETLSRGGGGLYCQTRGTMTVINCTVIGNSAQFGGGLYTEDGTTTTLTNTIIAAQTAGGDVVGGVGGENNLIGGNPLLATLGDFGGPTLTLALLPGSPAIGGGTGTNAPTTDQRGQPRTARVDIGAFQSQGFTITPVAGSTLQSVDVGEPFANPLAVTVTAINPAEPVDGGVMSFAAPSAGASASLSATTAIIAHGQAGVTATANATPGAYVVTAMAAGVTSGGFNLTNATATPSLVVDTVLDKVDDLGGTTSLREAIAYANTLPGDNIITFSPAVFGTTPQTITLTLGALTLTDSATITIMGPGARLLTINGAGASRVFDVESGSAALLGLTVSGGNADNGGGLYDDGGTPSLSDCTVSGNSASGNGGGLLNNSHGALSLTDCRVSGNAAGSNGGGLYTEPLATLSLSNCTVSGNSASINGAGLFIGGGTSTLSNCTVSGNSAGDFGGGL